MHCGEAEQSSAGKDEAHGGTGHVPREQPLLSTNDAGAESARGQQSIMSDDSLMPDDDGRHQPLVVGDAHRHYRPFISQDAYDKV